ncbi:MAG TPA: 16S rRNA (guanine(527)-N(7))-methyltransferase RsmG [Casimicrobiaceae bacterium]|nr:16S rRNA (guanine(527)-N(7))-methyltransferase RsmG [Casimicrobiaceae bacterium]
MEHRDGADAALEVRRKLELWLDLLVKWNRVYNLTAIRDRAQMETHHVNDALALLPHLAQAESLRVLDIGTGAGVPGIPVAIARPSWRVVLLDSNQKKIAFVTQAVAELGLDNVTAVAARAEHWRAETPFDIVVSRAYSDLASFAIVAARHVAPEGRIVAMKGAYPAGEIEALPPEFDVLTTPRLEVPGLDAERHLVVMHHARR